MSRIFAAVYDRLMKATEEACLATWRSELLAPLSGEVLEIGGGTGANLAHYPPAVRRLVVTEPDAAMRRRLIERAGARAVVIDAAAEKLPFADGSFDAVVCTLVLCSVRDPAAALGEIRRVLRPGGRFVFVEHVAADNNPGRLRWQRRIEPVWKRLMGNCHLTRRTEAAIRSAGFQPSEVERESLRKAFPLARPSVRGVALR